MFLDINELNKMVNGYDYIKLSQTEDINEFYGIISTLLKGIFNELAPKIEKKVSNKLKNIFSSSVLQELYKKAYEQWKLYRKAKMNCHKIILHEIKRDIKNVSVIEMRNYVNCKVKQTGCWETLKNVFNVKFSSKKVI